MNNFINFFDVSPVVDKLGHPQHSMPTMTLYPPTTNVSIANVCFIPRIVAASYSILETTIKTFFVPFFLQLNNTDHNNACKAFSAPDNK